MIFFTMGCRNTKNNTLTLTYACENWNLCQNSCNNVRIRTQYENMGYGQIEADLREQSGRDSKGWWSSRSIPKPKAFFSHAVITKSALELSE